MKVVWSTKKVCPKLLIVYFFSFVFCGCSPVKTELEDLVIFSKNIPLPAGVVSVHAPTIVEIAPDSYIIAFVGGKGGGGAPGNSIWACRFKNKVFGEPFLLASAKESGNGDMACWDPVFANMGFKIYLFYKIGTNPKNWAGYVKTSEDNGNTWTESQSLSALGLLGPTHNKPLIIEYKMANGALWQIICGSSRETVNEWTAHVEILNFADGDYSISNNCIVTPDMHYDPKGGLLRDKMQFGIIQPAFFYDNENNLRMFLRSKNIGKLCTSMSKDNGRTWSPVEKTTLQSNDSGIDIVTLQGGRILLAYNNLPEGERYRLNLAVSKDGGNSWKDICVLDEAKEKKRQICYPAIIQATSQDQMILIAYSYDRQFIKLVGLDPKKLPN
jgi:predicted neuraminidase